MRVLVLNAGSSSLKASAIEEPDVTVAQVDESWGADASRVKDRSAGVRAVLDALTASGAPLESFDAVGHRVVHGGPRFAAAAVVDEAVLGAILEVRDLAPLHNQVSLETIAAARRLLPDVAHTASFDTAFHGTLPPAGYRYPVPEVWFREWGVRRYGFHGLSVTWSLRRAAEMLHCAGGPLRVVVAHLGSGCSVTAVEDGMSADTSMGMTPLEGLMMGTRSGSIDPGILFAVLKPGRLSVAELEDALDHRSGLLGISGRTADMRELLEAERSGERAAALALELFVRRAAAGIAAAATSLPSLDALVFTGGIGANAAPIRARITSRLAVLGVPALAATDTRVDAVLTERDSRPAILRVEAREDLVIAAEAFKLLGVGGADPVTRGREGRRTPASPGR
jgi:acetate kinase